MHLRTRSSSLCNWLNDIIFVALISAAASTHGFCGLSIELLSTNEQTLSDDALIMILPLVNFITIKESTWMNTFFTLIELSGLIIVIIASIILSTPTKIHYFEMPQLNGSQLGTLAAAAGLMFFAYFKFENLVNFSEETKNASRFIPRAPLISIATTAMVYLAVAISAISLVGWRELFLSSTPLALQ